MPKMKPVDWRSIEKVFLKSGFRFDRQEGSHRSYVKHGISRPVVIPTYDRAAAARAVACLYFLK